MEATPDSHHIETLRTVNATIGGRQTIIADGQPIDLPTRVDLIAYLANVRNAYSRWADDSEQDLFVATRALPMRLAAYRAQPTASPAPSVELLTAVKDAKRTIILGEPGAGKTAALERLAWVTATRTLQQAQGDAEAPLTVPLLARLPDYRGEAELIPALRRALNELGPWQLGDSSVRLLLWAKNVRFMLLLDGLNELEQAHVERGRKAVRGHLRDYGDHIVHLSCRSADFDAVQEANPELQLLPAAQLWTVQDLVDDIRHWDDEGQSDVRDYLRFHLDEGTGKRVYDHLHGDDRLASMARIPLFLWMFRTAAEDGKGTLPRDRGELLHSFVHSPRVLGRVPQADRTTAERCLEWVSKFRGWPSSCAVAPCVWWCSTVVRRQRRAPPAGPAWPRHWCGPACRRWSPCGLGSARHRPAVLPPPSILPWPPAAPSTPHSPSPARPWPAHPLANRASG